MRLGTAEAGGDASAGAGAGAGAGASAEEADTASGASSRTTTIFGPTCDSLDIVFNRVSDVPDLLVGDWLLFPACGAYTAAGATDFNGIGATAHSGVRTFYVSSCSFERTTMDRVMPVIYSSIPPMEVRKLF